MELDVWFLQVFGNEEISEMPKHAQKSSNKCNFANGLATLPVCFFFVDWKLEINMLYIYYINIYSPRN